MGRPITSEEIEDELNRRFSRFGQHALSDADVWALCAATMVMPSGNPGAQAFLTQVAGVRDFVPDLTAWGRALARDIAASRYMGKNGKRRRAYVEGYDERWGRHAVADGLTLALFGEAPGLVERVTALGCGMQGYLRIRDFVGGALICALAEYRFALEWAIGWRRDRVFDGRWEGATGLKWYESTWGGIISRGEAEYFPLFAPGCARTDSESRADDRQEPDAENLYKARKPTGWWDASYAAQMKKDCAVTIYPTSANPPRC